MRLVIQRVSRAAVRVDGATVGEIGHGALVLVGIAAGDTPELADRVAAKVAGLRYFADPDGRTNLPIADVGGAFLVVSQFTLQAGLASWPTSGLHRRRAARGGRAARGALRGLPA